jgi:hypothetical protein
VRIGLTLPGVAKAGLGGSAGSLVGVGRSAFTLFRRAVFAVLGAGFIAAVLRIRGKGGLPPQGGGWQELDIRATADR